MSQKSSLDLDRVRHIARLANLALTGEEEVRLQEQLNQILEYFERLAKVPTDNVEPMSHSVSLTGALAPDVVDANRTGLTNEEILGSAPDAEAGHFRVPAVIE